MKNKKNILWIIILTIIVIIGLYNYYLQMTVGHTLTGISKQVPWGIYIVGFAFFVGASAGATVIGFLINAFGKEEYKPFATRAILIGLASIFGSLFFLIADVGNPIKTMLVPLVLHNFSSPFVFTSTSYYLFVIILLAELYYVVKITKGNIKEKYEKRAKWLAILAAPFALIVLHALTGSLFAFVKGREFWNSSLLPAHFAIAALASGTALVILVATISAKINKVQFLSNKSLNFLGVLLGSFVAITIFFDFFDIWILRFTETPGSIEAWHLLTSKHALLFVLNIGCLIGAILILLYKNGRKNIGLIVSSALVIIAIAAYRYNLVIVGQEIPLLPFESAASYSPTGVELSISFGIIAFCMLFYFVATKVLPMEKTVSNS